MIAGLLTAALFVVASIIEASFIQSLPPPFALFPLLLVCGILVMHRGDFMTGIAWLVALAWLTHPWGDSAVAVIPLLAASGVAIPLGQKIFTNRSVYALLGLGGGIFVVMTVTAYVMALFHGLWSDEPWLSADFFNHRLIEGGMLLVGLYAGDELARRAGDWGRRTFYLHR